jgi:CRISPR-associated protein Csh1
MLEGIRALGEAALEQAPLIEALVDLRPLEQLRERERAWLVVLNIDSSEHKLRVESRDLDEKALAEALWVGNAASSASPQDRFTTDNPEYLASQTVPNLMRMLPKSSLGEKLQKLLETVYIDLGEKAKLFPKGGGDAQYERYRRVWDLRRLGLDTKSALDLLSGRIDRKEAEGICAHEGVEFLSEEFLRAYARAKGSAKEAVQLVGQVLRGWVAKELEVKDSQIKLYTLALDGEWLVRHPDYVQYVERKLVEEAFEGEEAEEGLCHLCGASERVTSKTTRFQLLKFYITDKPGFASRLSKRGFLRNYTLCRECYRALLAGERFLENELRTRLGRSSVYVIPVFHLPQARPGPERLRGWAEYLTSRLAASDTLEKWHEFQLHLEKYRQYERRKALFVLQLLFATKGQKAVKVDKLIAEVPPSRLDQLDEVRNRVREWAAQHLGDDAHGEWDLGLEKLFYLLPLRQRDSRVEAKRYLELLDALLVGRPLSVQALIPQLLETAAIHRFERYEAHAHDRRHDPERALVLHLLQAQLLLRYLKELGQLHGLDEDEGGERRAMTMTETMAGQAAEIERELVDEGLRAWMDGVGLTGVRRGLFLLGVLIGKIGSTKEQRESGKPILNKVNFQGMDRLKVLRLANEVYEKLRQYKIADYNEGLYAAMKAHLDRGISTDELGTPAENGYWVLAGYAYETQRAIRAGQLKKSLPVETEHEGEED